MNWGAIEFYVATVLVIFGVDVLAAWALNLQFGFAGVPNFGFIVFQAAGAYVASVVTLGPSTPTGYQRYVFGANLPFPVPLVLAAAAGAALAAVIGLFAVRRMPRRLPGGHPAHRLADHRPGRHRRRPPVQRLPRCHRDPKAALGAARRLPQGLRVDLRGLRLGPRARRLLARAAPLPLGMGAGAAGAA